MEHAMKQQDDQDIKLAHKYRLSLTSAPRQSSFRVVAVVFYELLNDNNNNNNNKRRRLHVVGTNDEPCYMNGSICAERAALVQLRFLPIASITKVVITTDATHPIFPGMLCREFMSGHSNIDPEVVPIVTAGSLCRREGCRLDIGSGAGTVFDLDRLEDGCCCACDDDRGGFHDWEIVRTTLPELYPHPSPYTRLDASESAMLGKKLAGTTLVEDKMNMEALSKEARLLIGIATEAAQNGNDRSELHPIQYGAAVLYEDGTIQTACQKKALEYGCSLDAVTQLATSMEEHRNTTIVYSAKNDAISDAKTIGDMNRVIQPKLIVQADQFGVVHTPFATARAFLSEFGYGECGVLVQRVWIGSSSSSPKNGAFVDDEDDNTPHRVQIVQVTVDEIAPSAPRMGALWGK